MCWRTRPLSWMNSLVRFQSWVVVTAKFSHSRNYFSKIFYNIAVKVGFACGRTLSYDLDNVSRLRADRSHCRVSRLYVRYLEGFDVVSLEDLFGLVWFE